MVVRTCDKCWIGHLCSLLERAPVHCCIGYLFTAGWDTCSLLVWIPVNCWIEHLFSAGEDTCSLLDRIPVHCWIGHLFSALDVVIFYGEIL